MMKFMLQLVNSVSGDALENQRRNLLNEATTDPQRHQRKTHERLQEYQQGFWRHLSEVQPEVQVRQVKEVVENLER